MWRMAGASAGTMAMRVASSRGGKPCTGLPSRVTVPCVGTSSPRKAFQAGCFYPRRWDRSPPAWSRREWKRRCRAAPPFPRSRSQDRYISSPPCRVLVRSHRKKGTPKKLVTAPMGSSTGAYTVRLIPSQISRNTAPAKGGKRQQPPVVAAHHQPQGMRNHQTHEPDDAAQRHHRPDGSGPPGPAAANGCDEVRCPATGRGHRPVTAHSTGIPVPTGR